MIKEKLQIRGDVNIVLCGKDGKVKDTRDIKNLVVTTGLEWIADRMNDVGDLMTHMGVGSGNTAPTALDTSLSALLVERHPLDSTTVTNASVLYVHAFLPGESTGAIVEAGIFNALSGGDMLCRTVFDVVTKGVDDTMTISWTITISAV
jgi:hypothetical protein